MVIGVYPLMLDYYNDCTSFVLPPSLFIFPIFFCLSWIKFRELVLILLRFTYYWTSFVLLVSLCFSLFLFRTVPKCLVLVHLFIWQFFQSTYSLISEATHQHFSPYLFHSLKFEKWSQIQMGQTESDRGSMYSWLNCYNAPKCLSI